MDLSKRDYQLDNIKGLMMFCVVFAHAMGDNYF